MTIDLFWEIFGYIGTGLVILSMLMVSVVKLRVINICGSVISMIYAIVSGTYPIVLLNAALVLINLIQLIRMHRSKFKFSYVQTDPADRNLSYFLFLHSDDIIKHFPDYTFRKDGDAEAHLVYCGSEVVGILVGHREGDRLHLDLDYITPRFRDLAVPRFLEGRLKAGGITRLMFASHNEYLSRQGFVGDVAMEKVL